MSKPKAADYKASEVEKVNAAVAKADKAFFRQNYLPKQKEFVERSFTEQDTLIAQGEGRAQADTMQALTSNPNRRAVSAVDTQADLASAASAQQLQGTTQGLLGSRSDQVAGIKSANQMAAQTAAGLSQASKIATTDTLSRARAKQIRSAGNIKAFGTLAGQVGKNVSQYRAAQAYNKRNPDNSIPLSDNPFSIAFGRGLTTNPNMGDDSDNQAANIFNYTSF